MRWHFHLDRPADGVYNMAFDEALMGRATRTGDAVFRIYGWSSPTVSLGRNQRAKGCYDESRAREAGVAFVRRPTGGRALLHHREITYSATLPLVSDARRVYAFINDILLAALARMGVRAELARETVPVAPGLRPCFDIPAEHEIVVGQRKLVGSAQWRRGDALLQHGSILVRDDQSLLARLMKDPLPSTPGAACLADALGREPSTEEFMEPLLEALRRATGRRPDALDSDDTLQHDIERLSVTYADAAWTWRR